MLFLVLLLLGLFGLFGLIGLVELLLDVNEIFVWDFLVEGKVLVEVFKLLNDK